ncbi:PLP-dependent aminotransferase family protein [Rhizobium sp. 1AS11]|uniref:aminotransferase-like domain-containing protein n=1 Tax=Rhizobium acaciae TaxID=2989736 RepID=UPI0022232275|nr:PLP-dependent aminotransferase family protein [Rhizobium acaciae]MCW1413725.1 PLP-dependent aminotransferase family protein [Rhizobium acaciae]MCW1746132.1 PLP-dependent aminotransferase family protein [Rhizobium acaciae]
MDYMPPTSVMNFLNEVSGSFPSAISLASGRPSDRFFDRLDPQALLNGLVVYERYSAGDHGGGQVHSQLLQYGRTAGIISELVAQQVRSDEAVPARTDRVLITSGCQEALAVCLPALCPEPSDVLLVCNPTYIGATGAAKAERVAVAALPNSGPCVAEAIELAVLQLRRNGRRARAVYLIPDFDNPTGRVLDLAARRDVLQVCARHRVIVLEDNPYRLFRYEGDAIPPMAALDEVGSVIYLSTFSKTLTPSLRVGAAILPETIFGDAGACRVLWEDLVQRKSFVTLNTSQITQAIVAGLLIEQGVSLRGWIRPALDWYRANRDLMLCQLDCVFSPFSDQIRWNRPSGGFFLTLDLPFRFSAESMNECARDDNVIVMPMSFFALDDSQDYRIRLAFSAVTPEQIRTSVTGLGRYVARRLGRELPSLVGGLREG